MVCAHFELCYNGTAQKIDVNAELKFEKRHRSLYFITALQNYL